MGRVLVVGAVNDDRILHCATLPAPGKTVTALSSDHAFGGKGANQACSTARLGAETRMVAAVGADSSSRAAIADLRAFGVGVGDVTELPGVSAGAAHLFVDASCENFIGLEPGANAALTPANARRSTFSTGPAGRP